MAVFPLDSCSSPPEDGGGFDVVCYIPSIEVCNVEDEPGIVGSVIEIFTTVFDFTEDVSALTVGVRVTGDNGIENKGQTVQSKIYQVRYGPVVGRVFSGFSKGITLDFLCARAFLDPAGIRPDVLAGGITCKDVAGDTAFDRFDRLCGFNKWHNFCETLAIL